MVVAEHYAESRTRSLSHYYLLLSSLTVIYKEVLIRNNECIIYLALVEANSEHSRSKWHHLVTSLLPSCVVFVACGTSSLYTSFPTHSIKAPLKKHL